jgi:hypothetical protein
MLFIAHGLQAEQNIVGAKYFAVLNEMQLALGLFDQHFVGYREFGRKQRTRKKDQTSRNPQTLPPIYPAGCHPLLLVTNILED